MRIVRSTDVPAHNEVGRDIPGHLGEADFQQNCEQVARSYGWLVHHNADSRRADAGLPDLVMVSPVQPDGSTVIGMLELKTEKGKPTEIQELWLERLARGQVLVVGVIRPSEWPRFVNLCFEPQSTTAEEEPDRDPGEAAPQGADLTQAGEPRPAAAP